MTLKKNPAQVLGLAECQPATEKMLQGPAVAGNVDASEGSMEARTAYEYYTLRGREESSVLIAVRKPGTLEMLAWTRRYEGIYRPKSKNNV